MLHKSLLLLLLLAALSHAVVVNYHNCEDSVGDCTIDEVRVNPCPQAEQNAACHIRRSKQSKMSFDFTPNFDADSLDATLVWVKSETELLPLITMDREACKATSCPVKKGQQQTYNLDVPIPPRTPLSPYVIRWALQDPVSGKRCCFNLDIKVVR